jgi:hypothetical protein
MGGGAPVADWYYCRCSDHGCRHCKHCKKGGQALAVADSLAFGHNAKAVTATTTTAAPGLAHSASASAAQAGRKLLGYCDYCYCSSYQCRNSCHKCRKGGTAVAVADSLAFGHNAQAATATQTFAAPGLAHSKSASFANAG